MPTATSTITTAAHSAQYPLKGRVKLSPVLHPQPSKPMANGTPSTSAAPLRSLYNRAARAFLHRDILLTHSLIESAFHFLKPPVFGHDVLLEHRRKWDILRITLETTIYADPPSMESLPQALRHTLTESPQTLMTSIYARSVFLFTPSSTTSQKSAPNPGYLPPAVLITLLYSSLKVDCPDVGRMMAEEWLSRRESPLMLNGSSNSMDDSDEGGYDKILEIYCLHILPKLEQWDYAKEFLQFESELSELRREYLKSRLDAQRAETFKSQSPTPSPSSSASPTPRSHSPTPSSSSSSSLSTTSTHTIVPATPRGHHHPSSATLTKLTATNHSSSASDSSHGTTTPRGQTSTPANVNARSRSANSSSTSSSSALSSVPRADVRMNSVTPQTPTLYSLIRTILAPHLTTSKVTTFLVLFVLFPLLSWVLRIKRKRRKVQMMEGIGYALGGGPTNVDLVRKRLQAAGSSDANIIARVWREAFRAVTDTVKMAGRGLV